MKRGWFIRTCAWLGLAVVAAAPLAGESYLLDRAADLVQLGQKAELIVAGDDLDRPYYLAVNGSISPLRWTPPILDRGESKALEPGPIVPLSADASGRWFCNIVQDGKEYRIWRESGGEWTKAASGVFGGRIVAASGGRFAAGEGAGLFTQFDSGHVGYWRVDAQEGPLLIWQSPDPWPFLSVARSCDLNGDGLDELFLADSAGIISIAQWRGGLWEKAWTLPSWGQVLAHDAGQADAQIGLEVVVLTSQRRVFLIGATGGSYGVKGSLIVDRVAVQAALVPRTNGMVVLADAAGRLDLLQPEKETWRLEASLDGGERIAFLAGLDESHILLGGFSGALHILGIESVKGLSVFLDGTEVKNAGIYWNDGEFYFGLDFLRSALRLAGQWDEKKAQLSLAAGKVNVILKAGAGEALINGRPWPIKKPLLLVGKTPYVPAEFLRSVLLVDVTHDPALGQLILTTAAP